MAHDAIIESRVIQTHYANRRRRDKPDVNVGDLVYLSTQNLTLPKGRARKLLPKFIGPLKVLECHHDTSNYVLELPQELKDRRVVPTFHVGLLRRHEPNDDSLFPRRDTKVFYDFGVDNEAEWLVDEITAHKWDGNRIEFLVKWNLGDSTWEPYTECKELEALDNYLELAGVRSWKQLPRADARRRARR